MHIMYQNCISTFILSGLCNIDACLMFKNTKLLYLFLTEASQDQNQTEVNNNSQSQNTQQTLMILYFILSIVMFLAIIGLLQIKLQVCKKTHQQYQDEELEQLYSTNDEEFSEVEFRLSHSTNNTFGKKPRQA
ncbi:hypothetical protein PO909_027468 [Leuciscus waleckii]